MDPAAAATTYVYIYVCKNNTLCCGHKFLPGEHTSEGGRMR